MSENPPIRVRSLDHVTLVVRDLDRSRRFYVGLLGMQEVPRPAFSFEGLWFQAGGTQIHLILETPDSGPAGPGLPPERVSSRASHFAMEIDDARQAAERLQAREVPILSGPKPRPDGALQVFLTDPDGYIVELCSK